MELCREGGGMNTLYSVYILAPSQPPDYALELRIDGSNVFSEIRYRSDISVSQVQNTCSGYVGLYFCIWSWHFVRPSTGCVAVWV